MKVQTNLDTLPYCWIWGSHHNGTISLHAESS